MNDIVVFNFPAGDSVATAVPAEDLYRLSYQAGQQLSQPVDMSRLTLEQQRQVYDFYYQAGRKYIDENPQMYGKIITRPVDRRENYVKRCVGLPGQTLEIKNRIIYLDGKRIRNRIMYSIVILSRLRECFLMICVMNWVLVRRI